MRRDRHRLQPKAAPYVNKESDWETLPHNPLCQKNRVTQRVRTVDLTNLANLRMRARGTP